MKIENIYQQAEVQRISAAVTEAMAREGEAKAARDMAQAEYDKCDRALQNARVDAAIDKDVTMTRPFEKRLIDGQLKLKEAADALEVASAAATELAIRKEQALESARQRIAPGAVARLEEILLEVRAGLRPLLDLAGEFRDLEKVLNDSKVSVCPLWPDWTSRLSAKAELTIWRNLLFIRDLERGETGLQLLAKATREQAMATGPKYAKR